MPDDPKIYVNRTDAIGSPMERLVASKQKRDWVGVRRAYEELLGTLDAQAPPEIRAGLHYLIGDAIVASAAPSDSDLEAAVGHFQAHIDADPLTANAGHAYIEIGRAEICRGKAGNASSFGRAVAAFERAKSCFAEEAHPKYLADAYAGIGEAHQELGTSGREPGRSELEELKLALSAYKSAHRLYGRTDGKLNEGVIAFRMAHIEIALFDLAGDRSMLRDALGYLEQAEGVYRAARQDANHRDTLMLLAHLKARLGQPDAEADRSPPRARAVPLAEPDRPMQCEEGLSQAQFDRSMQDIQIDQMRRIYLRSWLDHHAPAEPERAKFRYNHIILPLETEAEAMRRAAKERGDAKLLERAAEQAAVAFEYGKQLMALDQEQSTHAKAVELLRAHLDQGDEFVLFLRNFDLEITKGALPKDRERYWCHDAYGAKLIEVVVTTVGRCLPKEKLAESLVKSCRAVEVSDIADVLDHNRSQAVSKLRVVSAEWELVVSMLIGEAAAVVVFAEGLTDGLTRELERVKMLRSLEKTTVLIIKPDDDLAAWFLSAADYNAKRLAFEVLHHALDMRFEGRLALVEQLTDLNTDEIAERIRSQVARKEMTTENPGSGAASE